MFQNKKPKLVLSKPFNTEGVLRIGVDSSPLYLVRGSVKTANNVAIDQVILTHFIDTMSHLWSMTNMQGDYEYVISIHLGSRFKIKATKINTTDKYAGVTTFDIAKISQHVLSIDTFTTMDQFLAADVNNDREIDASDMLLIRNLILRRRIELPYGTWRFIPKDYKVLNPTNPLLDTLPDGINYQQTAIPQMANFLAIKYGDINRTFVSSLLQPQTRSDKALNLKVEDRDLIAGEEYTIQMSADNFNAIAFQGTFSMVHATIKSVKAGDLENYGEGNFGVFKNAVTTSWNGSAKGNNRVFSITFIAEKNVRLSDILTINNDLTPSVANDFEGNEMAIHLYFLNTTNPTNSFELYQNTPNPTDFSTNIAFNLPNDSPSQLTFYSLNGQIILSKNIAGKAGLNTLTIQKSDLNNATGILFYRLETAGFVATKRMVILK